MSLSKLSRSPCALAALGFVFAVTLCASRSHAATYTWNGGTGSWAATTNWTPSGLPTSLDTAAFGGSAGTVTATAAQSVLGVRFTTTGYTLTGGSITLGTGGIDASTLSGGTTTIGGVFVGNGVQTWKVGAGATLAVTTIGAGADAADTYTPNGAIALISNTGTIKTSAVNGWGWRGASGHTGPGLLGPGMVLDNGNNTYDWASANSGVIGTATYTSVNTGDANNVKVTSNTTISPNASWASILVNGATLTLNGAHLYVDTGIILENGGTIAGSGPLQANADGLYIYVPDSGTISESIQNNSTAKILYKAGAGTLVLTGANTYSGGTTICGGTLQAGGTSTTQFGTGNVVNNAALVFNNSSGNATSNNISGNGSLTTLTLASSNAVHLSGNNTYSGVTTVNPSTGLELDAAAAASPNSDYIVNGKLEAYSNGAAPYSMTIGALSGSGNIWCTRGSGSAAGAVLTVGSNGDSGSFAGTINQQAWGATVTLGLLKTGSGVQVLTGSNLYTGATTISNGTLQLGNGANGSDGSINSTSGVTDNAALVYNLYGPATSISGYSISGAGGSVTQLGPGELTLAKTNSYAGGTVVSGGTLAYGIANALPTTGAIKVNGGVLDLAGLNGSAGTVTLAGGSIVNSGGGATLSGAAFVLQGGTASAVLGGNGAPLTVNSAGSVLLTASNTYTGLTTIGAGTLALGPAGTLGSGNLTIVAGGVLDVSAYGSGGYTIGSGTLVAGRTGLPATDINGSLNVQNATLSPLGSTSTGTLTISGSLSLNNATVGYVPGDLIAAGRALTLGGNDSVVVEGTLSGGTTSLFSYASGTPSPSTGNLTLVGGLGGRSTFGGFVTSGGTAVNMVVNGYIGNLTWTGTGGATAGVWDTQINKNWYNPQTSGSDAFFALDNVTFTDSGTTTYGTVTISGSVAPGSITVSNTNVAYTFNGTGSIGGLTSLVMNGQGSLTIGTSNTYSGGTSLSGGTLNANAASALGSGTLSVSGGVLNANAAQALPAAAVTVNGGTLNLYAAQSPTSVTLNSGAVSAGTAAALGSGPLVQNNGLLTIGGSQAVSSVTLGGGAMSAGTVGAGQRPVRAERRPAHDRLWAIGQLRDP